jgi:preprotein translocase subunit SecB
MVKLQVSTVPAGELPIPYRVALEVIGFFSVLPDMPEAEVTNLVYMNGSALLYSAAREYLLLLTGRGPWPALQLPTTNFLSAPAVDTVAVAENMST